VASPILSNIYLHRLDVFVETVLIPEYTRGNVRRRNPEYSKVNRAIAHGRRCGDRAAVRELRKRQHGLPSGDPHDPGYRRLHYVRYADDTLLGFTGPKAEAEEIKQRLATFLRDDLKLELSPDKTLITHARTGAARFLGYEVTVWHNDRKVTRGRRAVNGAVALRVPKTTIKAKSAPYLQRGKRRFFARALSTLKATPSEVVTDAAVVYPGVLEALVPAAWHHIEQYANNPIEADHSQLKHRLRSMRGLRTDKTAQVIIAGHAFMQNLRRGHYEIGADIQPARRVATAFTALAHAI